VFFGGPRVEPWAKALGVVASGLTFLLSVVLLLAFGESDSSRMQAETNVAWVSHFDLRFHVGVDGVSLPLVVLTALLTFLSLVYTLGHLPDAGRPRAFVGLILLLEVGMLATFVALDLLLFFVAFELVLAPMWFIIAGWGGEGRRAAANKFILVTLTGSAFMLLGFLLIWAKTGTLDVTKLAAAGGDGMSRTVQLLAFLAIGIGFAVKAPMWPLHTWLPDAHTAAPTVGSVLLAGVLLKMGTYGFVRIALPVVPAGARDVAPYLAALAVVGIIYGSLACLGQRDLKRLIAYSSVGHMGFVLLGIATLTSVGINGALYANVAHGLITGLLFFLVGGIKDREHTTDLVELRGALYARAPRLGSLLAFAAVASLGLPGLAGFWGEFLAMFGAFRPDPGLPRPLFIALMVAAGVGTVLTAAYLLAVVRRVAQGPVALDVRPLRDVSALEAASWAPLALLVVLLGLMPWLLLRLTDGAVGHLLGALG
jgi:NADH-quinone oxidoreductase subunit M